MHLFSLPQRAAGISDLSLPPSAPGLSDIAPSNLGDAPPSYTSAMRYQQQNGPTTTAGTPATVAGGTRQQQGGGVLPPAYESAVQQNAGEGSRQNAPNTNQNNT